MELSNQTLIIIGGVVVAAFGWALKSWMQNFFEKHLKAIADGEQERIEDNKLMLKGQMVISDCLHETMYAVINGEHNGGLQRCDEEITAFHAELSNKLVNKAANWNNKINGN